MMLLLRLYGFVAVSEALAQARHMTLSRGFAHGGEAFGLVMQKGYTLSDGVKGRCVGIFKQCPAERCLLLSDALAQLCNTPPAIQPSSAPRTLSPVRMTLKTAVQRETEDAEEGEDMVDSMIICGRESATAVAWCPRAVQGRAVQG